MNAQSQAFVFVVCGAREHTDTLHYSLRALLRNTNLPVYIVTDTTRNEQPINHNRIIDIETPKHFNHHQASIYLKTGLHKFLPKGPLYCYLDTDVIALTTEVNEVFKQWKAPVTFSHDHCTTDEFSPYAANCTCRRDYEAGYKSFTEAETEFNNTFSVEYRQILNEINQATAHNKRNLLALLKSTIRYYTCGSHYPILNGKFLLDKSTQRWQNAKGEFIDDKYNRYRFLKQRLNLDWNEALHTYLKPDGTDFFKATCTHLHQLIKKDFGQQVTPENFRHWNGGMFLFNEESESFLTFWHQASLRIFELPEWKTRDQGTLIATVFYFGLQHHSTIDIRFNLIIDYFVDRMKYLGNLTFNHPNKGELKPVCAHVFHHFGDTEWNVWNDIDRQINN